LTVDVNEAGPSGISLSGRWVRVAAGKFGDFNPLREGVQ